MKRFAWGALLCSLMLVASCADDGARNDTDTSPPEDTETYLLDTEDSCELNSGYPCSHDGGTLCGRGDHNISLVDLDPVLGICTRSCDIRGEACPTTGYDAVEVCLGPKNTGADSDPELWCYLVCNDDLQCPADQDCMRSEILEMSICYP